MISQPRRRHRTDTSYYLCIRPSSHHCQSVITRSVCI